MKRLNEGAKIYFDKNISHENRMWLSNGVERMDHIFDVYDEKFYEEKSFVPKKPWVPLSKANEAIIVTSNSSINFKENIAFFRIPESLSTILKKLGLSSVRTLKEAQILISKKKELYEVVNEQLNSFASTLRVTPDSQCRVHGLFYLKPGLITLGSRDNNYIGLHIDNGEAINILDLPNSDNRICINLGCQDRYLLFVNQTTDVLLKHVAKKKIIDYANYKETELVFDFLSYFPDYPVTKVLQRPFEAYIAPTDNLIHDGSTDGMSENDITLVLIGEFKYTPFEK